MFACWPRLEPSAMNVKAEVEQPVFVKPAVIVSALKAPATTAQPIAKEAIGKLASALRDQPSAPRATEGGSPGATLAIPIDDGRRLCAEGLVAFAKGRHRDRPRLLRQRGRGRRRPGAGRARRHVRSRDLDPSRRRRAQGRWRQGARLLRPRPRRRRDRSSRAACGFGGEIAARGLPGAGRKTPSCDG